MCISSIHGLQLYIIRNSGFSGKLINDVIVALGYNPLHGTKKEFIELSGILVDCVKKGVNSNIKGFSNDAELYLFFQKNRKEIGIHLQLDATGKLTDLASIVQNFYFYTNKYRLWALDIEKALWDNQPYSELTEIYNAFSLYTLDEISKTWYRLLEENPVYDALLTA